MVHPYLEGAGGIVLTHIILKTATLHMIEAIHVKIKTLKLFKGNRGDYFMTLKWKNHLFNKTWKAQIMKEMRLKILLYKVAYTKQQKAQPKWLNDNDSNNNRNNLDIYQETNGQIKYGMFMR